MVELPRIYTQEDLRVDNREIATAEKLKKWKYLNELKPVMSVDDNKEVNLLIGVNWIHNLEPGRPFPVKMGGPIHLRNYYVGVL